MCEFKIKKQTHIIMPLASLGLGHE